VWTIARLGWGFIALTSVMQDWLNSAQKTVQYYSLILVRALTKEIAYCLIVA
jgi:hypothetical protein